MRAQHLLGSELLPCFQAALRPACELRRAAMGLQSVSAEHHPNLVERKPIERLSMLDRGKNALCHLRHNQRGPATPVNPKACRCESYLGSQKTLSRTRVGVL